MLVQIQAQSVYSSTKADFLTSYQEIYITKKEETVFSENSNEQNQSIEETVVTDAEISADIGAGFYKKEDYDYLVATLGQEASSFEGKVAVGYSIINRAKSSGTTIKSVCTAKHQYTGYRPAEVGKARDKTTKNAAVAVLKGTAPNMIGDRRNFFGLVRGYDMCWEPSREARKPIMVGGNVFYNNWGAVHNKHGKHSGCVILYDNSTKKWK